MKAMTKKQKLELVSRLEKELSRTCQRIYELATSGRRLIPNHPYLLVRVLPKEHKTEGGIWLADTSQSKPIYEGIVLEPWKPYTEHRMVRYRGEDCYQEIYHKSELKTGDRIVFPHYEGVSLGDYLDDKHYRLVREINNQKDFPYMTVMGTLDYKGDSDISAKIRVLTAQMGSITTSGLSMSRGANPNEVAR